MKTVQKLSVLLVCLALGLMSMECDNSPEPPHVKYISYQVSAVLDEATYTGPKQLVPDIKTWIDQNEYYEDFQYEYSTGAASEFTKYDANALKKYDPFKTKFLNYLENDIRGRLSKGSYGKDSKVSATFRVFAERGQGQERVLKEETVNFTYP